MQIFNFKDVEFDAVYKSKTNTNSMENGHDVLLPERMSLI